MKLLLPLLILLSFIQTTVVPIDLVLLVILAKSYLYSQSSDYLSAFIIGLTLSLLTGSQLGITSLALLSIVFITHLYQKSAFAKKVIFILPIVCLAVLLNLLVESGWSLSLLIWPKALFEIALFFPIFALSKIVLDTFSSKGTFHLKLN